MSDGYGGGNARTMRVAVHKPGSNCNALMPVGVGSCDPLSCMSWLSAVPVEVKGIPDAS